MAFSNVYFQAGLFDEDGPSEFSVVSSNSGGCWFETQFFYSQEFYDAMSATEDLSEFLQTWMDNYDSVIRVLTPQLEQLEKKHGKKCKELEKRIPDKKFAKDMYNQCVLILGYGTVGGSNSLEIC